MKSVDRVLMVFVVTCALVLIGAAVADAAGWAVLDLLWWIRR